MMTQTESTNAVLDWSLAEEPAFAWTAEDDTVVPSHHTFADFAFTWKEEDDTVVPGHHTFADFAFTWKE